MLDVSGTGFGEFLSPLVLYEKRLFMAALSNALAAPQAADYGFDPIALPPVKSTRTGVSVGFVSDPMKQWFVMRATYARERRATDFLVDNGYYAYLPMAWSMVSTRVKGKKTDDGKPLRKPRRRLRPMLNLILAYLTEAEARDCIARQAESCLTFYYDHFSLGATGYNPPLVVPEREVWSFILATSTHNLHVCLLRSEPTHFCSDDEVDVVAGEFRGVRGRVIRLAGQQRVYVSLAGTGCMIATAYIPTAFLRKAVDN
jgi:hypothetical protein